MARADSRSSDCRIRFRHGAQREKSQNRNQQEHAYTNKRESLGTGNKEERNGSLITRTRLHGMSG